MNELMTINGVFLKAIQWSMQDERTGQQRSGTSIQYGTLPDGNEFNPTKGYIIKKFKSAAFDFFDKIPENLAGKQCSFKCRIHMGKTIELEPLEIKLSTNVKAA